MTKKFKFQIYNHLFSIPSINIDAGNGKNAALYQKVQGCTKNLTIYFCKIVKITI